MMERVKQHVRTLKTMTTTELNESCMFGRYGFSDKVRENTSSTV